MQNLGQLSRLVYGSCLATLENSLRTRLSQYTSDKLQLQHIHDYLGTHETEEKPSKFVNTRKTLNLQTPLLGFCKFETTPNTKTSPSISRIFHELSFMSAGVNLTQSFLWDLAIKEECLTRTNSTILLFRPLQRNQYRPKSSRSFVVSRER